MAKRSGRRRRKEDKLNGFQREPRKASMERHLSRSARYGDCELMDFSFNVTSEPLDSEVMDSWPGETQQRVDEVYRVLNGSAVLTRRTTKQLKQLIEEYPDHLPFKNWLINLYELTGKERKALHLAEQMYAEHPDYLFSRIKLSNFSMSPGKHFDLDRADELLGGKIKMIQSLAPDRDLFHISEVIHYHMAAATFHCLNNDNEQFEFCRGVVMQFVEEESPQAKLLNNFEENWELYSTYAVVCDQAA